MKENKLRWFDRVVRRTSDSDTMIVAMEIDVEKGKLEINRWMERIEDDSRLYLEGVLGVQSPPSGINFQLRPWDDAKIACSVRKEEVGRQWGLMEV